MTFISIKNESPDIYLACSVKGRVVAGVWGPGPREDYLYWDCDSTRNLAATLKKTYVANDYTTIRENHFLKAYTYLKHFTINLPTGKLLYIRLFIIVFDQY